MTDERWARRRRKRRKLRKGRIPPLGILPVQDGVLDRLLRRSTADGHDDDNASVLSLSSSGV